MRSLGRATSSALDAPLVVCELLGHTNDLFRWCVGCFQVIILQNILHENYMAKLQREREALGSDDEVLQWEIWALAHVNLCLTSSAVTIHC